MIFLKNGWEMDKNRNETFYRDGMDLSPEDEDKIDTFAASLGFGPKFKSTPSKKYTCPKCKKQNAYYSEIHPDTDINEIILHCPDCGFEDV